MDFHLQSHNTARFTSFYPVSILQIMTATKSTNCVIDILTARLVKQCFEAVGPNLLAIFEQLLNPWDGPTML